MKYQAHSSAIVDIGAKIGDFTVIWHWSHICAGAIIGEKCSFGQNVYVGNSVTIGNNVKVQNNVSIYDGIVIEDDVFCGPSMVFTNVYNPRSAINRKNEYRATIIHKGVSIGANATIICGVEIGQYAFIGAGAVIRTNVKSFALMVGNPAQQIGWISEYGERLDLPLEGNSKAICPITGKIYILEKGYCICTNTN